MNTIRELMSDDHRACDDLFVAVEKSVGEGDWVAAAAGFGRFSAAMLGHFESEEAILFPAFEARTGMRMGPTQVMRGEHAQMRELITAAESALSAHDASDYSGFSETLLIMMQQHNMKEENVLYPMCDQNLADQCGTLLPTLERGLQP
jgi:iron-sulfur cluster repair protein YtfE (RIC family)